jgi:phosphate starvation-inducible PhoH-like protein
MSMGDSETVELTLKIDDSRQRGMLYGPADRHLRRIRTAFDVKISAREDQVRIIGDPQAVGRARTVLEELQAHLRNSPLLDDDHVVDAIRRVEVARPDPGGSAALRVYLASAHVTPRTPGQVTYVEAIRNHDLTICLGPAGTGKTYLAVAVAVSMLKEGLIRSIVLVRPAVEAGEKLGFLPGDLQAKVNPYLRPLFDAMHDMMPFEQVRTFIKNDIIEIVPLAFMRGRTLNHAAVILDEAQNATVRQMLMFLTRLGNGSKMIATGDDTQVDLEGDRPSGLTDAVRRLEDTEGVAVVRLTEVDIVRHPLVQRIVDAYGPVTRARG